MITLQIENVIGQLDDGSSREMDWTAIEGFAIHRAGIDLKTGVVLGYDAVRIGEAFIGKRAEHIEIAKVTGFQNPYTIYIGGDLGPPKLDGKIWQALPLGEVGFHARAFSYGYTGICLIGDPRVKPVSRKQRQSLVDLLAVLCIGWAKDPYRAIRGHGEIPGSHDGTKAPGEPNSCPGLELKDLNILRDDVATIVREKGLVELDRSGLIFG